MSERWSYSTKAFAETVGPYATDDPRGAHTKLSISLPAELVEVVRAAATERGTTVSGMIAATLRKSLEDAEQARLDAAIEAQNDENLEWAKAYLPIAAALWSEIEW